MTTLLLILPMLVLEQTPLACNVHVYSRPGAIMDIEFTDYFSATQFLTWAVLKRITNATGHAVIPVPRDIATQPSKFFRARLE